MASNEASIEDLTKLLAEFHGSSTSPSRRQEIQILLVNFESSPNAWYHAICYLSMSRNQYVVLYCLGVIETTIIRQWLLLSKDDKLKMRSFLKDYLHEKVMDQPNFLLKKAAKLLSLTACFDWPDQYTDYMEFLKSHIFIDSSNNLTNLRTSLMGWYCLKSMYESFLNPPEMISYSKRNELQKFLRKETTTFCGLLCSFISHLCGDVECGNLINLSQSYLLRQNSQLNQNSQHSLWQPLLIFLESLASDCLTNSGTKCYTLTECFECLHEVLKLWPGQPDLLVEILVLIFLFSLIGSPQCLSACAEAEVALALSSHDCDLLRFIGLTALTCLHELVEKRNVDSLMTHQSSFVFQLITCHLNLASGRIVLNKISTQNGGNKFNNNNHDISSALAMDRQKQAKCDDYEMKLVEIIRCILPSCLKFVYTNNNLYSKFSMDGLITFLQAFREFTFFTSNFETYLSCINIWSSVFESLQFSTYQSSDCLLSNSNVHRILSEFGNALFSRLFYSESSAYLDTLDYDIFENEMLCVSYPANNENSLLSIVFPEEFHTNNCQNNEPCEYVVFIRESLSTFHHLVGLLPHDFTVLLFQRFQCILNEYTSLVNSTGLLSGVFNYPKGQPVYRVHWILRDFASIVQVIGFMSEKFCCEKYQEYGQQILRALMYCLRLNSVIFPALHNINERLIRLSFVEVIVQVFLVWRALIVSGSIGFITDCINLSHNKIYLSSTECEHFYSELMDIFQSFFKPLKDTTLSSSSTLISSRIIYSCTQFFNSLFTSSFRDIRPPSSIIFNVNSRTFTIFNGIFDSVCEQKCQTSINYNILNSLVSSFLFYLTSENEPTSYLSNYNNTNDKQNKWITIRDSLLNRLIVQLFLPNLNQNNFEIAQKQHITYLSLLNHSILSLENAKNSTRQLVYTILINSGLMDNLVNCLLNKILTNNSYSTNMNSDLKIRLCTAYLIFLATFVRILSISSNSLSSIPQLIGQIIHSLCTTSSLMTISNSFSIHVIGPIIDILLLITHQKIFLPILKDTFELCICVFLPILSTIPNAVYTDDVQIIHQLIMNACANNSQLIQQLFGLIFTILSNNFSFFFTRNNSDINISPTISSSVMNRSIMSRYSLNNPDIFHRVMYIFSVVLHPEQVNSSLVKFIIEKLVHLNASHKLFDLYDFNKSWLSVFTTSIFNLLIDNKHNSCKDTLTESVYYFAVSFTHLSCPQNSNDPNRNNNSSNDHCTINNNNNNEHQSNGLFHFVQHFLPSYLNTVGNLDNSQRDSILSCFYDTNQREFYTKDITVFNHCIELLVYNIRYYRTINLAMTTVSLANSHT